MFMEVNVKNRVTPTVLELKFNQFSNSQFYSLSDYRLFPDKYFELLLLSSKKKPILTCTRCFIGLNEMTLSLILYLRLIYLIPFCYTLSKNSIKEGRGKTTFVT